MGKRMEDNWKRRLKGITQVQLMILAMAQKEK
jgi:hypothetical protein